MGFVVLCWSSRRGREGGGERKTGAPEEGKSTRLVKSQHRFSTGNFVRKAGCVPALKVRATQQLQTWAAELPGHRLGPGLVPAALNPNTQGHPLSGKSTEGCHHESDDYVSCSRSIGHGSLKKTMVGWSLFTLFPIRKKPLEYSMLILHFRCHRPWIFPVSKSPILGPQESFSSFTAAIPT